MATLPIGRPRTYNSPQELWDAFVDYHNWIQDNPFIVAMDKVSGDGDKEYHERKTHHKMRAMTIVGFCIYSGMSQSSFYGYDKMPEFLDITTRIKEIVYEQKFTGAAADLLNANIIARDLGLSDKREVTSKQIDLSTLSEQQLERIANGEPIEAVIANPTD